MKKIYLLENLGCANCAAKIEKKAAALPGAEEVTITFATKQLRITAENPDALIPEIQEIANSLEPDIKISEYSRHRSTYKPVKKSCLKAERQHEHCGCDHESELHQHGHCGCGHESEPHQHEHCGCDTTLEEYASVCSEPLSDCISQDSSSSCIHRIYLMENLGCANCAAKMESQIKALPGIASAS
ncbi:MAG: cation transporter, partial [Oscillospiraceae bacterium]|nr:cation transporter [Oscillospiraceae bacterium]